MFDSYSPKVIIIIGVVVFAFVVVAYSVNFNRSIALKNCLSDETEVTSSCLLKMTMNTFKEEGYESAYSFLEEAEKKYLSPPFTSSCEDAYYFMGQRGYEVYLEGKSFSFPTRVSVCTEAFYEGILNIWEKDGSGIEAILNVCTLINSELPTKNWDQCFFNIGQASVFREQGQIDNKIAKQLVNSSIDFCERIPREHVLSQDSCVSGVFGALNLAYLLGDRGIYMDPDRPLAFCEEQAITHQMQCYRNLTSSLYYLSGKNLVVASEYISSIEDFKVRYEVTLTLFNNLAFESVTANEVVRICTNLRGYARSACIQGYATGLVEASEADAEIAAVLRFCSNNLFTTKEKGICIYRAFYDFEAAYPGEAGNMCREMVDETLKQYCPV